MMKFYVFIVFYCLSGIFISWGREIHVIDGLKAVHMDIEPHATPEWDTDWESVARQFLDLMDSMYAKCKFLGLKLVLDMNADLDGAQCTGGSCMMNYGGENKQFAAHIIDRCDEVVIMDYFDYSKIVEKAEFEVSYADSIGKTIRIGINLETNILGIPSIETAFATLWDDFVVQKGFSALTGFAVHHYGYYRADSSQPEVTKNSSNQRELYWWCSTSTTGYSCKIYNDTNRSDLLGFSLKHATSGVYIDAPAIVALPTPSYDATLLTDFITRLKDNGISSQLIYGAHSWSLSANHHIPLTKLDEVDTYLKGYGNLTVIPDNVSVGRKNGVSLLVVLVVLLHAIFP